MAFAIFIGHLTNKSQKILTWGGGGKFLSHLLPSGLTGSKTVETNYWVDILYIQSVCLNVTFFPAKHFSITLRSRDIRGKSVQHLPM